MYHYERLKFNLNDFTFSLQPSREFISEKNMTLYNIAKSFGNAIK